MKDSRNNSFFPIPKNLRLKTRQACRRTVTSSWKYASSTNLLWNRSDLLLLTREQFLPRTATHLVHNIIRYVRHRAYIIEVFLSVKVVRVPWFSGLQTESGGSLCSAHGRKDTLSINTKCSIFILMIFRPFVISLGFHFSTIALFKIKCKSNGLALCTITTILLGQGLVSQRQDSGCPTRSSQEECLLLPHRSQSPPSSVSSYLA